MTNSKFFYIINYPKAEESLAKMELKYIFGREVENKYLFSDQYIAPSRSSCLKGCLSIIYTGDKLEDVVQQISNNNVAYDRFKVQYIKNGEDIISYEDRLNADRAIGFPIIGEADIHNPQIILGITHVNNKWLFGEYEKNNLEWQVREQKPHNYSNALGVRTARAIVNIAINNSMECKMVDPCCGIGTVVMEALSLGIDIKGYEINPLVGENAKKNLSFFNFDDVITIGDMHSILKHFDSAVIDLPYGLFSPATLEEQKDIMETARRIADRAVFVTLENMDKHIIDSGFQIVDRCHVSKGKFKRYISICS